MRYRTLIQCLVVSTSFPPFNFIYRKIYEFSVAIATALLRREARVMTIYLRRGVAEDEITYGLSDIDLLVLVRDEEDYLTKVKIRSIYNRLSLFIPLYGNIDTELGIYSISEFISLYHDHNLHRYRFNEGKYSWKLLFGEDILKALPELDNTELYLSATEELKVWWRFLGVEINPALNQPRFQRKYLWYKAISETAKVYLFIRQGKKIRRREEALNEIKQYMPAEYNDLFETVQRYYGKLNSQKEAGLLSLLEMFVYLVSKTYEEAAVKIFAGKTGKRAKFHLPDPAELSKSPGLSDSLVAFTADLQEELKTCCNGISVIPQLEFDHDTLNNLDIDSFYLVFFNRNTMPLELLRKIYSYFGQNRSPRKIEPFIVFQDKVAFSLRENRPYTSIKTPWINPEFFSLAYASKKPFLGDIVFDTEMKPIHCNLPTCLFEESILKRVLKIDQTVTDRNIRKVKMPELLRFFWAAARTKLLAHALESEEIFIPLTSRQILQRLLESYPGDVDWLKDLHEEYNREISGAEGEAFRHVDRALDFIKRM
jgi:predicted nucleotidyltransferase